MHRKLLYILVCFLSLLSCICVTFALEDYGECDVEPRGIMRSYVDVNSTTGTVVIDGSPRTQLSAVIKEGMIQMTCMLPNYNDKCPIAGACSSSCESGHYYTCCYNAEKFRCAPGESFCLLPGCLLDPSEGRVEIYQLVYETPSCEHLSNGKVFLSVFRDGSLPKICEITLPSCSSVVTLKINSINVPISGFDSDVYYKCGKKSHVTLYEGQAVSCLAGEDLTVGLKGDTWTDQSYGVVKAIATGSENDCHTVNSAMKYKTDTLLFYSYPIAILFILLR